MPAFGSMLTDEEATDSSMAFDLKPWRCTVPAEQEKSPGSVVLPRVRIWVIPKDRKIRISVNGAIIGTVDPKPSAARQAHLYRKLKRLLETSGKWIENK